VAGEFLRGGVAQVIASQWDVRDDLAADAMDDVHEALGAGAAPWDAVRLAQQRLRARGVAARDWAGYVAYTTPARR
jgi:CHAT domain-containing protein